MNDVNPTADQFCDSVIVALSTQGAAPVVISMVDEVFRPYLNVLDLEQQSSGDPIQTADALEATVAMMISNFVRRVVKGSNLEQAQDATQEIIDSISVRLSDDLAANYTERKPGVVIDLPRKK